MHFLTPAERLANKQQDQALGWAIAAALEIDPQLIHKRLSG
ncbi:MAG: hypothetical protein V4812_10055 [Pseudomonadota bacterium]